MVGFGLPSLVISILCLIAIRFKYNEKLECIDYGRQEMFKLMSENNSNDSLQSTTRNGQLNYHL